MTLVITQGERVLSIVILVEYLHGTVNETVFVTEFVLGGENKVRSGSVLVWLLLVSS